MTATRTGQRGAGGRTPDAVDSLPAACSRPTCPGGALHELHLQVDARCAQDRAAAEQAAAVCAEMGHDEPLRDWWRVGRGSCGRCGTPLGGGSW